MSRKFSGFRLIAKIRSATSTAADRAMSFHVGQQVVCVNDRFSSDMRWRQTVRIFPIRNAIYTIREIHVEGPLAGFCFHEIVNPCTWFAAGFGEPAFNSRNFRPVKTTSIEVFERLLAPADQMTRAPNNLVDA
jgi:hypothetical protein